MDNKFALSFGVSLVIVGFLNIFFETSNVIIFGLSVSTTIFSIINIIVPKINSDKSELLYILPFVILVSIFCYNNSLMKYDIVKIIVNGRITNVLTFVSFGFLFVSEFLNYKKSRFNQRLFEMNRVTQEYEYSSMILMFVNDYMEILLDSGIKIDDESREFLGRIIELSTERGRLANIDSSLLDLNKDEYAIEDFDDIFKKHSKIINYDEMEKELNKKRKVRKKAK